MSGAECELGQKKDVDKVLDIELDSLIARLCAEMTKASSQLSGNCDIHGISAQKMKAIRNALSSRM